MKDRYAQLVGLGVGLALLALVAAFAIGLPKATGEEGADADGSPRAAVELPDELPGGMLPEDTVNPARTDVQDPQQYADQVTAVQKSAVEGLEDLYDAPAAVRGYRQADGAAHASIIVVDVAPGLFDPNGPPVDPSIFGFQRSVAELVEVDDAICSLYWQQPVPPDVAIDPDAKPLNVQCQLGSGERTYELSGDGLTAKEAATILRLLVAAEDK